MPEQTDPATLTDEQLKRITAESIQRRIAGFKADVDRAQERYGVKMIPVITIRGTQQIVAEIDIVPQ